MSLRHRNVIACLLIVLSSVCWAVGQNLLRNISDNGMVETTNVAETNTIQPMSESTENESFLATQLTYPEDAADHIVKEHNRGRKLFGTTLCFIAVASAGLAFFALWQKAPIIGPDGVCFVIAILGTVYFALLNENMSDMSRILMGFAAMFAFRELLGWVLARFSLSWCLVHRIAGHCAMPQMSLFVFVGWIILALAGMVYYLFFYLSYGIVYYIFFFGFAATALFGFGCLWKYGSDLNHFREQLNNYQKGMTISVGDGAFGQTEAQLLDIQAQHKEAVRTAVTSERFKVELISNVSHDLRTPLTAILGYSELLQKEALSETGQLQLSNLTQKAGYMRDLVESLFELTQVSSGAVESKQERIDLVRLLEQTIGLFDDQLTASGFQLRRNYEAEIIPVITDGARMHQVFANLLGNAIKYALPDTRIYLEVKERDNGFQIRLVNTASYEMDFQPGEITQRFARGDKARSTKGSGLGLAIAQTYTESVGGKFHVAVDGDQFSAVVWLPKD